MAPENFLECSQESASGLRSEPDKSNLHHILFLWGLFQ
jgi:hypothetical protein